MTSESARATGRHGNVPESTRHATTHATAVRSLVLAAFLLGLLVGCQPNFVAPTWLTRLEPSAVTDSAAADALACGLADGRVPVRRYSELAFWADPRTTLGGYAPGANVVLRADLANNRRLIGHELLHSLFGIHGHPALFERCGVAMKQI